MKGSVTISLFHRTQCVTERGNWIYTDTDGWLYEQLRDARNTMKPLYSRTLVEVLPTKAQRKMAAKCRKEL